MIKKIISLWSRKLYVIRRLCFVVKRTVRYLKIIFMLKRTVRDKEDYIFVLKRTVLDKKIRVLVLKRTVRDKKIIFWCARELSVIRD